MLGLCGYWLFIVNFGIWDWLVNCCLLVFLVVCLFRFVLCCWFVGVGFLVIAGFCFDCLFLGFVVNGDLIC